MRNHVLAGAALLALATGCPASAQQAQPAADGHIYTSDLVTRWGRGVTPENAWRSYPRPQMKRTRWLNLNGLWDYAIRPKADAQPNAMDGKILVPFPVESKLSGVARKVLPSDRIWYRRSFALPADWQGQDVLLHFGAVDYEAHIFVNGSLAGSHKGGSDKFAIDVTDYLKPGENSIVVQVLDPTSAGPQPRGKQQLNPKGIWYTSVSGIWQTVWLEPVPKLHIEDMKITPDIDRGTLAVDVALNRSAQDGDAVRLTASKGGAVVASLIVRGNRRAVLNIPDAHLWSPEDPFLYDLKAELVKVRNPYSDVASDKPRPDRGRELQTAAEAARYARAEVLGAPADSVDSYFAMRKVSIGPGAIPDQPVLMLNNKPYFQNGPLDQGWWPDGLLTPPSEEAVRWEIGFVKRAGFNMLRKHIKVEPDQYYAEADRQGLLIWQDMPSGEEEDSKDQFLRDTAEHEALMPQDATNQFETELTQMIADLRNHPSIVTWVVNNEGWGQYDSTRLAKMVRALDPSRLIDKVTGWLDTGDVATDMFDIHAYENPPRVPKAHGTRAIVIGEFGGIGRPMPGHMWFDDKRNWGYQGAKDAGDYEARYRRLYAEIERQRKQFGLSAVVYTQTSDVEGEINGLLTYDREASKLPVETFAKIHAPLYADQ